MSDIDGIRSTHLKATEEMDWYSKAGIESAKGKEQPKNNIQTAIKGTNRAMFEPGADKRAGVIANKEKEYRAERDGLTPQERGIEYEDGR